MNEKREWTAYTIVPLDAEAAEEEFEYVPVVSRRLLGVLAAVLCVCALAVGGTMAFFTAEETAYNVITTAVLDMELVERTAGGELWPKDGISGVVPGMEVVKEPYVENRGGVDFYTRLSVEMRVTGEGGKELSTRYITLNYDRKNWTEKDGWFYYNRPVAPGGETKPLFTKVKFDEEMGNAYMGARVEIDVVAQAVQSRNNGTDALTATGWSEAK